MDKSYVPDEVCSSRVLAQPIGFPFYASSAVHAFGLLCTLFYEGNSASVGYRKTDVGYILHLSSASVPGCLGVPDLAELVADNSWTGAAQAAHIGVECLRLSDRSWLDELGEALGLSSAIRSFIEEQAGK